MSTEHGTSGYSTYPDDVKRSKNIVNIGVSAVASGLVHPLHFAKVLIQLGYEPFPIQKGPAWQFFGKEKRYLPNGFVYAKRFYQSRGLSAIYAGVSASICGNFVGAVTTIVATEHLVTKYGMGDTSPNDCPDDPNVEAKKFLRKLTRGTLAKTAGIVAARPFQVAMIRMMAQQIGGEHVYNGLFSTLREIYREEGLPGLFSGLLPQIAYELCIYWTTAGLISLFDLLWNKMHEEEEPVPEGENQVSQKNILKTAANMTIPFVANSIYYPLSLVSTVMAVNGSGMVAGGPPFMPIYPTWRDCLSDLSAKDQLKRGAKQFFRFYEKPITYRYGEVYAIPNA